MNRVKVIRVPGREYALTLMDSNGDPIPGVCSVEVVSHPKQTTILRVEFCAFGLLGSVFPVSKRDL